MEFIVEDNEPFIRLYDGKPHIRFDFSDCISEHLNLLASVSANLGNVGQETVLSVRFPLAEIVDSEIDGHRLGGAKNFLWDPVQVDVTDRPYFDAIRAALQDAIGQIDKIEFVTNGKENAT